MLKNTLLMFDYETESLWPVISGEAITGIMKGERLKEVVSSQKISWQEWFNAHPNSKALSYYGQESPGFDNYMDYHTSWIKTGIFPVENRDPRLKPKTTIIGLNIDGQQKAYPLDLFKSRTIITDRFGGLPLLIYHDNSTNNTIVYKARAGKHASNFNMSNERDIVVDSVTGSKWNLKTGDAIEGKLKGKRLEMVDFKNAYWFIWAEYYPDTAVYK